MPFRETQYGRFSELCKGSATSSAGSVTDPDVLAAHALATVGHGLPSPHPNPGAVLATKHLGHYGDPSWVIWEADFKQILIPLHQHTGGAKLAGRCTRQDLNPHHCVHELTPPWRYWSLRGFAQMVAPTLGTNVQRNVRDRTLSITRTNEPAWNYVITLEGEILVGAEDFDWIKHTALAGGLDVWAAGEMGFENGILYLANLNSGHYVRWRNPIAGSSWTIELTNFVENTVNRYCHAFGLIGFLDPAFVCRLA